MAIGIILGIVFFILIVGGFIAAGALFDNCHTAGGVCAVIFAIVMIFCFILVPFSFHTVDTGEVAVVKHLGEAKEVRNADKPDQLTSYFNVVANTVDFSKWFFGHYHNNAQVLSKFIMLYEQIVRVV